MADEEIIISRQNRLPAVLEAALLPWEDPGELASLHGEFLGEHRPQAPTERHLLEQLVLLTWRKRRVAMAERALHMRNLRVNTCSSMDPVVANALLIDTREETELTARVAVTTNDAEDQDWRAGIEEDRKAVQRAIDMLRKGGAAAYDRALGVLTDYPRDWWTECLSSEDDCLETDADEGIEREVWQPTAADLLRFLETKIPERHQSELQQIEANPRIRAQAYGQSLDPISASKLQTYDVRLDRQFERTLGTLLQLQTARRTIAPSSALKVSAPA
jgi:hypothetical protein